MNDDPITFSSAVPIPVSPNPGTTLTFNGIRNDTDNIAALYITPVRNQDSEQFVIILQSGQTVPIKVRYSQVLSKGTGNVNGLL
jgi:hypothetical protein